MSRRRTPARRNPARAHPVRRRPTTEPQQSARATPLPVRTPQRPSPRRGQPPTRLRLTEPGDLVGIAPYLLGFHPEESVVAILLEDGKVKLTARMDLPPLADADLVIEQVSGLADTHNATAVVVLLYSATAEPARAVGAELLAGLASYHLVDALYVNATRWWSLICQGSCCPADGVPYDRSSHPMAAEAIYAGMNASSDRQAIAEQVMGPRAADTDRLGEVAQQTALEIRALPLDDRQAMMAGLVETLVDRAGPITEADAARLAVLAADVMVRDVAWAMMSRDDAEEHVDLWRQVVATTVAPLEPAPLCLLGVAAWISGNGALQNCCVDRVRRIDPSYSMATLLAEINERALSPRLWDQLGEQMRAETGLLTG